MKSIIIDGIEYIPAKKKIIEKITDRVKTFEDACEIVEPSDNVKILLKYNGIDKIMISAQAVAKIMIIAEALNEGWKPDWNNDQQYKWYPWFYLNKPGFRFLAAYYVIPLTYSTGGSRLCFATKELAKYAGEQFLGIYKDLMD